MDNQEAIDVMFNEWKCIDRNDGIHCDRKCESCDLVMDVGIIREAYNMAISALQAQELSETQKALDTISRQAAIEAIDAVFPVDPMKSEYAQGIACGAALAKTYVEQLPPAQTEVMTQMSSADCISRAAAIEAVYKNDRYTTIKQRLDDLPSAQPIDVQEAYYRGKIDGIEECMTRMKKVNEEFANG